MAILDTIVVRGEEYQLVATPYPNNPDRLCNFTITDRDGCIIGASLVSTWLNRTTEARAFIKRLERRARRERRKAQ